MKAWGRWIPLLLLAYFTGETLVLRLSGRTPSQVAWPWVYLLILANLGWIGGWAIAALRSQKSEPRTP